MVEDKDIDELDQNGLNEEVSLEDSKEETTDEDLGEQSEEETIDEVFDEQSEEETIDEDLGEQSEEETIDEDLGEQSEEETADEDPDEIPLENSEEEIENTLMEEGSLDGEESEVEKLAEETADEDLVREIPEAGIEEAKADEQDKERVGEEPQPAEIQSAEEVPTETSAEEVKEEKPEVFKLTAPDNLDEILSGICMKRGRKLIYRPNEAIFELSTTVLGTDKNNEEKIKIKNILDAEIKQGVKLGYLDKFDGLKTSELKEEYENDTVYEFAEQEFKRTGLFYDGKKVKVYVFDWDLKACHHVGYVSDESAELLIPYLVDREKYSFDVNGIITGGKFKKFVKDEESGKITIEKGNDGKLGVELDITILNRKD
ncbi:MAG: hypothetical protein IJ800_02300 [Clostridia bacterium]|nr:hypothetical protein [Clostridia bacterium]